MYITNISYNYQSIDSKFPKLETMLTLLSCYVTYELDFTFHDIDI